MQSLSEAIILLVKVLKFNPIISSKLQSDAIEKNTTHKTFKYFFEPIMIFLILIYSWIHLTVILYKLWPSQGIWNC